MKIIERIHDVETGKITDVERELSKAEVAERQQAEAHMQNMIDEVATKEAAKTLLLERLGITSDEAKLLLG